MKGELFKRILVPVDGSHSSINAFEMASSVAQTHGSELLLLHVLDVTILEGLRRLTKRPIEDVKKELGEENLRLLHSLKSEIPDIPVETLLREGSPHEEILDVATEYNIDLIIIGRLGKRESRRSLIGSVTERVIEFSKAPVLVVT